MTITASLVLFAVFWFLILFIVLPLRLTTQGDLGRVLRGTPASAPENLALKPKLILVTAVTLVLWALVSATIIFGWITLADIDLFSRFGPGSGERGE